jgi:hypothetical protein
MALPAAPPLREDAGDFVGSAVKLWLPQQSAQVSVVTGWQMLILESLIGMKRWFYRYSINTFCARRALYEAQLNSCFSGRFILDLFFPAI